MVFDRRGAEVFDCGDWTRFEFERISSEVRYGCAEAERSRMSPLLSCTTPALVASCFGFASKIVMGVLLFTFKHHKNFGEYSHIDR